MFAPRSHFYRVLRGEREKEKEDRGGKERNWGQGIVREGTWALFPVLPGTWNGAQGKLSGNL